MHAPVFIIVCARKLYEGGPLAEMRICQGTNRINSTENTTGDFRQDQHAGGGEENSLSTVDLHDHDRNAELHVRRS